MSLGGGSQKVKVKRTDEEKEAQRLYVEGLQVRNQYLPFLMQDYGIGVNDAGNLTRLPKTPQQQGVDDLSSMSLSGAQQAAQQMFQRLQMSQAMLPGLMRSVQASMAPGTSTGLPSWMTGGHMPQGFPSMPALPPLAGGGYQDERPPAMPALPEPTAAEPGPMQTAFDEYFPEGAPSSDTLHGVLKGLGYSKKNRKQMPLSTALALMGGDVQALTPFFTDYGYSMDMPLKQFFKSAPFNTGDYDFTLQQIMNLLQQTGGPR